ncbi:aldo/keto reductase [Paraburkholderia caribensis]|uniref:aldo/keto reductase n=1 Tax=Paraburkholderia caribensis TaxID=75105 RepID=UPI001CAF6F07|nr:aldo/keto reductase [Paraburkholderia caribensis]CAG9243726.1 2,5-diketo-D-gluconic acid reductase B [Paraburkholderia caribensis]
MDAISTQGISIPRLGFGTFRMPGGDCQPVVESALELGYRHIDTAEMYQNEEAVGAAIATSGVARKDLHITTKVWHENISAEGIKRAFDTSLMKLGVDYIDLYMVHWPSVDMNVPMVLETMQSLLEKGLTRAIGVCNFNMTLLKAAIEDVQAPIACLQIEYHPFLSQSRMLDYVRSKQIPLVAYAPLAQGRAATDPVLEQIASKHGATAAQVAIAWLLDQDSVITIPKAKRRESQEANLGALNIKLDDEDRAAIQALPKDQRFVTPPFSPDWAK